MLPLTILLATGSTGGHVAPALAIGEGFRVLAPDARLIFAGPSDGVARAMVEDAGQTFEAIDVLPLRGAGTARWLRGGLALPGSVLEAARLLGRLRPELVVGTGGHTSGPLLAAAAAQGRRTLLFEANVEPGLANVWLTPLVGAAAHAWPDRGPRGARAFVSGCPVRRDVLAVGERPAPDAAATFDLLVLGGSAASAALDGALVDAAGLLAGITPRVRVAHQASGRELERVRAAYRAADIEARVEPFFPRIAEEYARCHVVLARAGGITLGEIAAAGRPSIVVPLPAAGDHQRANAASWARRGCGIAIAPEMLTGVVLADAVRSLATDPARRAALRAAALELRRPDAARAIAERGLRLVSPASASCASRS